LTEISRKFPNEFEGYFSETQLFQQPVNHARDFAFESPGKK